jgi:hypothetical protein
MATPETNDEHRDDKGDFYILFADPRFSAFLESEVKYRVNEQLRVRHSVQNAIVAVGLLVACIGLALSGNAYLRLKDARTKNDQLATTLTKVNAVLKVVTSPDTPAKEKLQ